MAPKAPAPRPEAARPEPAPQKKRESGPATSPTVPGGFGRYTLLEKIAAGGMAEVFRARSRGAAGFEKILVIKRILPHLAETPEMIDLFMAFVQGRLTPGDPA